MSTYSEETKAAVKDVIAVLRPMGLTIAGIREVLRAIDETLDKNAVLK